MAEWSGALSPGREAHAPVSPESATPVTPWETPWSNNYQQQLLLGHENQPTPCNRQPQPLSSSSRQRSFRDGGQDSLLRERELERGQRRLRQQHYRRQTSLNLLEVRSINRALDQRQLEARGEIAELRQEQAELRDANHALRADLREARAFLEHVRDAETKLSEALTKQVTKLSAALTKQVSLLISEKERRRNADKGLERCQAALAEARGVSIHTNNTRVTDCFHSSSFASSADKGNASISSRSGSTDGSHSSIYGGSCRSIERSAFSSATPIEPPLPAAAAGSKHGRGCLPLREVLEGAKLSLAGTMGRWLKGMHAACSPEVRRALILPWVLHKLFYLSTELIDARREELRSNFVGGVLEGVDREESAYLTAGLPLSGDNLRTAIHNIMMALARSMVESEAWNQSVKDLVAVQATLAASGLDKIVEEYLKITVVCCLQQRVVTFTDDLGEVERYSPERHSEPIDGEPAAEWCIVVFPAFVVAGGDGGTGGEEHVVGKRLILNHQRG